MELTGKLQKELEDFLGSRYLSSQLRKFMKHNTQTVNSTLYRGLPFNKYFIKKGYTIHDWYGCGHWTDDIDIAKRFAKDYINDEYEMELVKEYGENNVEFVPIILAVQQLKCFPSYKFLKTSSVFFKEHEYTTINSSYTIVDYHKQDDFYLANVICQVPV